MTTWGGQKEKNTSIGSHSVSNCYNHDIFESCTFPLYYQKLLVKMKIFVLCKGKQSAVELVHAFSADFKKELSFASVNY